MKKIILLLLCSITIQSFGQLTVNRKIGQRWDKFTSNAWDGQDSIIFNYNPFGLESNRFAEKGLGNNTWLFNFRITSTYDAQQNVTSVTRENWTSTGWLYLTKYTYAYNAGNLQTEVLYQVWNTSSNAWRNNGRIISSYSGSLKTKVETFGWDGTIWQPTTRQNLSYDASNLLLNHEFYSFSNSIFEKVERRQYQYAFGFVSSYIRSISDSSGANWELSTRTLSSINGSAIPPRISLYSVQSRDLDNNLWVDSLKTSYSYANNLLSMTETERYYPSTTSWTNISLNTYFYNGNNLLSEEKNQTYSQSASSYQNTLRKLLTYNATNLNEQTTFYGDDGNGGWTETERDQMMFNTNDSLIYRLNEDYQNNAFTSNEQYFYHYANVPVGVADYNNLFTRALLYPSPSATFIAIDTKEKINGTHQANIYSLEGKKVWSQTNSKAIAELKYNTSNLSTGNYILQIVELSSGKAQHFKFSKK